MDLISFAIVAFWGASYLLPPAGTVEGGWRPAAAPMRLTSAAQVEDTVVFSGTSARLRPECSPRQLEWFQGAREGHNVPVVVSWGKPEKRPNGTFAFSGWVAEMDDVVLFKLDTFSDVLHQCRWGGELVDVVDEETGEVSVEYVGGWAYPFLTRTRFYR